MVTARMKESIHICASNGGKTRARKSENERNPTIQAIRMTWEIGINEELQAMAIEKKRPFARPWSVLHLRISIIFTKLNWYYHRPMNISSHPLLDQAIVLSAREDIRFLFDRYVQ